MRGSKVNQQKIKYISGGLYTIMKHKFSNILGLGLTLALLASLLLVAAPVSANVSQPTVDIDPPLQNVVAEYTIGFDINTSLSTGGDVEIDFPAGTTVPATGTYSTGDITIQCVDVTEGAITVDTRKVKIVLATDVAAPATVTVVFKTSAGIENPGAGTDKVVAVQTSAEPVPVDSETYDILALPAVTGVEPVSGNVDDTMWVEVGGTGFTGDTDTNVSTTTLDFGTGITVVSTKYVSVTEIDVQITIVADGAARTVIPTSLAGQGAASGTFTANIADTEQVDRWATYTPVADALPGGTWGAATLAFEETTATIQEAIDDAATNAHTIIVHAGTYNELLGSFDGAITLQSLSGAGVTEITNADVNVSTIKLADAPSITGLTIDGFTITSTANQALFSSKTMIDFTLKNSVLSGSSTVTGKNAAQIMGGLTDATFKDNVFKDSSANGLNIFDSSGITVTGNTFENNSSTGAVFIEVTGLTFNDNTAGITRQTAWS